MYSIEIGPLSVNLHRTVRVKAEETSNLPPSLGHFEIFKVKDFKCPESWDKEAYFITMFSQEAMWMSFQAIEPLAIVVGAGSINALNGKSLEDKLEKDSYMVIPPQPWLDGWKGDDGTVYQFIATEVGENKTIGEQLSETKDHSIIISVYKAKNPEKLKITRLPPQWAVSNYCSFGVECAAGTANLVNEMGLGKGGKIIQKIYDDPHGLEEWEEKPVKTIKVYLINASEFSEITGQILPKPADADKYNGKWYELCDEKLKDVPGTKIFDNLKSTI